MLPALLEVFVRKLDIAKYWGGDRILELRDPATGEFHATKSTDPMWGRIILRSAESEGGLESATAKGAWLDEAGQDSFSITAWEAIQRRLTINLGRALISTTIYNFGWLKTHVYDKWAAGDPHYDVIRFDSTENPNFPQEEFDRARAGMPEWRFNMQYRGMFTRPAGQIYNCFDRAVNTCPRFAIPDGWKRYLGLDFGGVNTAGLFLAMEPGTGRLFGYREYKAGERTAKEHAAYLKAGEPGIPTAVGGSHSEGQWRREFANAGLPIREPDIKEVEVGIDRVYGAFKRGELVLFDDLAGTIRDVETYSRKLDKSGNPTEDIENKASYHFCFIAGTMIETEHGSRPIESILPGDLVWTRKGLRPVEAAFATEERPVSEVTFSDGNTLVGTNDHPIWIHDKGFVRLDALRYNNEVFTYASLRLRADSCQEKSSSSRASITTAIPSPQGNRTSGTSSTQAGCSTGQSGSSTTEQSRTTTRSIIGTTTPATTASGILNSSAGPNTEGCTTQASAARPGDCTWSKSGHSPSSGINPRKAEPGTESTLSECGPIRQWLQKPVKSAAANTPSSNYRLTPSSAQTNAGQPLDTLAESTTKIGPALIVATSSGSTDTAGSGSAAVRVRHVRTLKRSVVHNLTVAEEHEYFANGVLVSNCDSARYIIGWLKRPMNGNNAAVGGMLPPVGQPMHGMPRY